MTYKDRLCESMRLLARDKKRVFIGYNVLHGGRANGTLNDIPDSQLIETPVAENLVLGLAIGMAIDGWKPVVWIERFDFMLNASDAIVNHLDKLTEISAGEFSPAVIIRTCVGGSKNPLFSGPTHTQDLTESFSPMVGFNVHPLKTPGAVISNYILAAQSDQSWMMVEYRDLYGTE